MSLTHYVQLFQRKVSPRFAGYSFLGVLVLLVLLVNIPNYTYNKVIWTHEDTRADYQTFHFFYNEFYFHHKIPQWMPYFLWGYPSRFLQQATLSGIGYLSILLGTLFNVKNSYLMWNLSVWGEQIIFLVGLYALSTRLFTSKKTVVTVCLAASGSLVWYWHIYLNLRLIYVLPIILYWIVLFFSKQRPYYLWLGGITLVIGGLGSSYFLIFTVFIVTLFSLILFFRTLSIWKALFEKSYSNLLCFLLFIAVAGSFVYGYKTSLDTLSVIKEERSASGVVSLDTFLHFHGNAQMMPVLTALLSGNTRPGLEQDYENNLYIGLLPIFFFLWGVAKEKRLEFWAIVGVTIILIGLSFGGLIGILVYVLFPFMKYTRYTRWVYGYVKVFLVLGAGYGVEHFWIATEKRQRLRVTFILLSLLLLLFDAVLAANKINILENWNKPWLNVFFVRGGVYLSFIGIALCGKYLYGHSSETRKKFLACLGVVIVVIGVLIGAILMGILSPLQHEGNGLLGTYYPNTNWEGSPWKTEVNKKISDNPEIRKAQKRLNNKFSMEWTGAIKIDKTDNYTFYLNSDDGSWLWIDDTLVVDNGGVHGLQEAQGTIRLRKGVHKIRIRYFQIGGVAILRVFWANSREPKTLLPPEVLLTERPLIPEKAGFLAIVGYSLLALLLLSLIFYTRRYSSHKRFITLLAGAFVLSLVFDLASYQYVMFLKVPKLNTAEAFEFASVTTVQKDVYQEQRKWQPETKRQSLAFHFGGGAYFYPMVYMFAQFDPCLHTGSTLMVTRDIHKVFHFRQRDDAGMRADPVLLNMVGCETPKLQLVDVRNAIYANSEEEATRLGKSLQDITGRAIIETEENIPLLVSNVDGVSDLAGSVEVTDYTSDRILIKAHVKTPDGAWLVYADAYHPSWRARVDGQRVQIVRANLAFKAVSLTPGDHVIEFVFGTWQDIALSYFLWYFGACWVVGVCGWVCFTFYAFKANNPLQ